MSKKSREKETKRKGSKQQVSEEQILAAEEWFRENENIIPADAKRA